MNDFEVTLYLVVKKTVKVSADNKEQAIKLAEKDTETKFVILGEYDYPSIKEI